MCNCRVLATILVLAGMPPTLNLVNAQNILSLTVDDGLSQGYAAAISCDEDGYIWVGTLNGLNRFDGHTFQTWYERPGADNGLSSNFVVTLLPDSDGLLWLSTSKGLQAMNRRTGQIKTVECMKKWGECSIQLIVRGTGGKLWLTDFNRLGYITIPSGALDINEIANRSVLSEVPPCPGSQITSITSLGDSLLLTTEHGVFFYNIKTQHYHELKIFPKEKSVCAIRLKDNTILVRYQNWLYASGHSGLQSWPMEHSIWNGEHNIQQQDGSVFIFSKNGFYRWVDGHPEYQEVDKNIEIVSAAIDRSGQIWLGSNAQGIKVLKQSRSGFRTLMKGKSIGGAKMDAADQMWIAEHSDVTGESTLRLLDTKLDKLTRYHDRSPMKSTVFLKNGDYWFLDKHGMICKKNAGGRVVNETLYRLQTAQLKGSGRILFGPLNSGEILISDYSGNLLFYNPANHKERLLSYDHLVDDGVAELKGLVETPDGRIWVSTNGGLIRINTADLRWKLYSTKGETGKTISAEKVNCVVSDPDDPMVLWAGTAHGLNRIDCRTEQITFLTKKDGLIDDFIYTILPGKPGEFWLGTNHGLLQFNKNSHQVIQYTVADGLPASEFNTGMAWAAKDSTLYFGTVGGLVFFNPFKLPASIENPGVRLSALEVNGRPYTNPDSTQRSPAIPYASYIALQPWENNLAFRFTVMDFFNYEKYNCRYKLVGADDDWRYAWSNNLITYANLSPGNYTFLVSVSNSDGGWSEPRKLDIYIRPHWWFRWWAYLLWVMLLAIGTATVIITRRRISTMRRQLEMDRLEAKFQKELEAYKTQMFTNIAHEIRTPLTILMGLAEEIREKAGPRVEKETSMMQQSGKHLLDMVGQITNLIKLEQSGLVLHPQTGDLGGFILTVTDTFLPVAFSRKITLTLKMPDVPLMTSFDPQYMRPVISNLLSNAIKFTPQGGKVTVTVQKETSKIKITVEDTGIGISTGHLERIFDRYYQVDGGSPDNPGTGIGLTYAAELVKLMGGSISVNSIPGSGSSFTIALPVSAAMEAEAVDTKVYDDDLWYEDSVFLTAPNEQSENKPIVLVVEDNREMAGFIIRSLQPYYQTIHASNGAIGLNMAVQQVPDLIVTDVMMPEMNGYDFCAAVKKELVTSHIPVMMLTARAEDSDILHGLKQGADIYLPKPFSREILLQYLSNLLVLREKIKISWSVANKETATPEPEGQVQEHEFIRLVMRVLAKKYSDPSLGVNELARSLQMSNSQLHRKLLSLTGKAPGMIIREYRLETAKNLLETNQSMSIAQIAYSAGFRDPNYFSQVFAAAYGVPPSQFRN